MSQTHIKELIFFIVYMGIINQIEATDSLAIRLSMLSASSKKDNKVDTFICFPLQINHSNTLHTQTTCTYQKAIFTDWEVITMYPMESKHWRLVEGVVKYIAPLNPVSYWQRNCWHELSIVVLLCTLSVINPFWNDIYQSFFSRDSTIKPVHKIITFILTYMLYGYFRIGAD